MQSSKSSSSVIFGSFYTIKERNHEKILLNMFNHNVITDDKEKKGKSR